MVSIEQAILSVMQYFDVVVVIKILKEKFWFSHSISIKAKKAIFKEGSS